jgi:uncharacterized protein involved in exopolysaccharide biosynthesis
MRTFVERLLPRYIGPGAIPNRPQRTAFHGALMLKKIEAASLLGVESDVRNIRREHEELAYGALKRIWRGKWLIVATVVAANLAALFWLIFAEPRFTSTATVEFGFGTVPTMAAGTEAQGVDANSVVESAAQILRSRGFAAHVSDALRLDQDPEFVRAPRLERLLTALRDGLDWSLRALPGALQQGLDWARRTLPDALRESLDWARDTLPDALQKRLDGIPERYAFRALLNPFPHALRTILDDLKPLPDGLEAILNRLDGWPDRLKTLLDRLKIPPPVHVSPQERATDELTRRLSVTHASHTYLITIAATSRTPELSAEIANSVARQYLRQERRLSFETHRNEAERSIEALTAKFGDSHPDVLQAKERLATLVKTYDKTDDEDALVAGRLVHPAQPQELPSSPSPKLALQIASALGLLAGVGLSLLGASRHKPARKPAVREGRRVQIAQYQPHPERDAVSLP